MLSNRSVPLAIMLPRRLRSLPSTQAPRRAFLASRRHRLCNALPWPADASGRGKPLHRGDAAGGPAVVASPSQFRPDLVKAAHEQGHGRQLDGPLESKGRLSEMLAPTRRFLRLA